MHEIDDIEILPLSLEHNFWTWSAQEKVKPIPIKSAKGVYFWDVDGKRYLDFNSMVMCVNIGHGDERVIEAIVRQARELPYAGPGMATKPARCWAKILAEITPAGLDAFLYTLGGADANENAIKLARAYTGRHKILARYRSYHGASSGAMALDRGPAPDGLGASRHAGGCAFPGSRTATARRFTAINRMSLKPNLPRITSITWKRSFSMKARKQSRRC